MNLPAELVAELTTRGLTLATAESLTGGDLASAITGVPGASATFLGGVVSYATHVKVELLGVTAEVVRDHGVISAQCAEQMARGARRLLGADLALSTTGVAGPEGQEGKPVGLAYIGVAGPHGVTTHEVRATGSRAQVREHVVAEALRMAGETVLAIPQRPVGRGE